MKKFWIFCALVFAGFTGYGQTALTAGDVVFVGFNVVGNSVNAPNYIALLCRKPIDPGTSIYITNQDWNGTGFNALLSGSSK